MTDLLSLTFLSSPKKKSTTLEVFHGFLVFLCRSASLERAEIPALSGLRIFLAGIQSILTRPEFPDHLSLRGIFSATIRKESASSAPKIARSRARCPGKLQFWLT